MTEQQAPYTVTPPTAPAVAPEPYVPPPPEKKAFLAAFAAAQGEYLPIVRNRTATIRPSREKREQGAEPYTFTYAELATILDACRPALCKNGLSIRSRILPSPEPGHIWLQSILAHADGWEDISEMHVLVAPEIKTFGGQLSYLRRYIEGPQLGVASEDDLDQDGKDQGEGEGRVGTVAPPPPAPAARRTPQPRAPRPPATPATPAEPPAADPAGAEFDGQPPAQTQAASGGQPLSSGQAKWIVGKLAAYFTEPEAKDWLQKRGINMTEIEKVPAARFEELRADLMKLEAP